MPAVTTRAKEPDALDGTLREEPREPILHRLGEASLYFPGDPGSGKSTFSAWVAYVVAHGAVPENDIPAPEDLQERLPGDLAGRLPLLVRLRDFWGYMGCKPGQGHWTQRQIEAAIGGWLRQTSPHGLTADVFERNLGDGNLLHFLADVHVL